jgi:hypothetical protein
MEFTLGDLQLGRNLLQVQYHWAMRFTRLNPPLDFLVEHPHTPGGVGIIVEFCLKPLQLFHDSHNIIRVQKRGAGAEGERIRTQVLQNVLVFHTNLLPAQRRFHNTVNGLAYPIQAPPSRSEMSQGF